MTNYPNKALFLAASILVCFGSTATQSLSRPSNFRHPHGLIEIAAVAEGDTSTSYTSFPQPTYTLDMADVARGQGFTGINLPQLRDAKRRRLRLANFGSITFTFTGNAGIPLGNQPLYAVVQTSDGIYHVAFGNQTYSGSTSYFSTLQGSTWSPTSPVGDIIEQISIVFSGGNNAPGVATMLNIYNIVVSDNAGNVVYNANNIGFSTEADRQFDFRTAIPPGTFEH